MERERLIKAILGDRYEEGKEIAEIVLKFVSENPDWNKEHGLSKLHKHTTLKALDKAILEVYGHNLEHYAKSCRKREFVNVRQMSMYLYHKATGFSLNEVGEIFGKHHSTVLFAYHNVENLRKFDKAYAKDFAILEKTFKKYL